MGFEVDNHEFRLKHMVYEILTGHVRRCSLDSWMYGIGVEEVRSGGKKNLCEQIFDQIFCLMGCLFWRD